MRASAGRRGSRGDTAGPTASQPEPVRVYDAEPRTPQPFAGTCLQRWNVDWAMLFHAIFFVLFVAYPSISLRVLQTFLCTEVEGEHFLLADIRTQCYTRRWARMAVYSAVMGVVYVLGLPIVTAVILIRHRRAGTLFEPRDHNPTISTYGFLYADYGPSAWWWEVEETVRKLLLSTVVAVRWRVTASPLQPAVALLICIWAHLLHTVFKPWGVGSSVYVLQHCSLAATTAVFFLGTLVKLDGIGRKSLEFRGLTTMLLLLIIVAVVLALGLVVAQLWRGWRQLLVKHTPAAVQTSGKAPQTEDWGKIALMLSDVNVRTVACCLSRRPRAQYAVCCDVCRPRLIQARGRT
jgi:hypothetical protein